MDLSIIIVNWNTRELLRECLASVCRNLEYVDAEIIVVDNGSDDDSVAMVERAFPQVRLIRNEDNRGFAAANNQAMQIARGRYFLLLNSDTQIAPDVLRNGLQWMDKHENVAVSGCRALNPDGSLQSTCFRFPDLRSLALMTTGLHRLRWPNWCGRHQMREWNRDSVRNVDVVTGCFMLIRRDAIVDVGLFDEQFFFYGEETDWCLRFRANRWAVQFAPYGEIIHHGAASALRLDERRTLMLSEALTRLHRKHRGRASAVCAWLLLASFAATRAAGWTIFSALTQCKTHGRTARRYRRALTQFSARWLLRSPSRVQRLVAETEQHDLQICKAA